MKALVAALLLLAAVVVFTASPKCPNCDPCTCGIADCECEVENK